MTASVLIYVQYLLGIGHLQRALRIADALASGGAAVTLVTGGMPIATLRTSGSALRKIQLPPIQARDAHFELFDDAGAPLGDRVRTERRNALLAAFSKARPDAVVLEGFPFARRAFRFELDPLIAALRAARPRPLLVSSIRDILVARDDPARTRDIVSRVRTEFDAVLVHGDPGFIPLEASFPAAPEIADRLVYTGYIASPEIAPPISTNEVLVSGGGGPAGYSLMQSAVAACRLGFLPDSLWRLLAGANLPDDRFAALAAGAPANLVVDRFRSDFPALLRGCRVSVSQAGYNTVLDLLAARARAVLVPFAAERETEQLLRAERLAALGAAELVHEQELTPATLGGAIERAAAQPAPSLALDIGGAEHSARAILALIGGSSATALANAMMRR